MFAVWTPVIIGINLSNGRLIPKLSSNVVNSPILVKSALTNMFSYSTYNTELIKFKFKGLLLITVLKFTL